MIVRIGVVVGDGAVGKVDSPSVLGVCRRLSGCGNDLDVFADLVYDQCVPGELLRLHTVLWSLRAAIQGEYIPTGTSASKRAALDVS
jgi:hypothetical protein